MMCDMCTVFTFASPEQQKADYSACKRCAHVHFSVSTCVCVGYVLVMQIAALTMAGTLITERDM